ncbi:glycosyltransferase family 1 protein [Paenibacillaceae bacterium]|nr:glycosyltransferase family 1 protein [Paenibacillaceae bacterium]
MLTVAYYNHTSEVSGAEVSLLLMMRNLSRTKPVLFAPEGELTERARAAGIEVIIVPSFSARNSRNPLRLLAGALAMIWFSLLFARAAKQRQVDLIHANSIRAGLMTALFAFYHRVPIVWHVRDMPPEGIVGKAIRSLASRTVRAVVVISNAVLAKFTDTELGEKTALVYNGVEIGDSGVHAQQDRAGRRSAIRFELLTPEHSKVVVVVGQIAPWKRQADAIEAVRQLRKAGEDVYLWVVGAAKFREENEQYWQELHRLAAAPELEGAVRFTGFRTDVADICEAADLLVLCSDNEPFGRVLIEALAQGRPVIGTRAGGIPEIIEHDGCGFLYPVGNVKELAHYIRRLTREDKLRQAFGRQARVRAEQFAITNTVRQIEQLHERITRSKAVPPHLDQRAKELA